MPRDENLSLKFIDNPAIAARRDGFVDIQVDVARIMESYRDSIFSFEWIRPDGNVKTIEELSVAERSKREAVETLLSQGKALCKPVLGIGLMENVEIGIGRAEFLTLASLGHHSLPVHVPVSNEKDFKNFLCSVR